MGRTQVVYGTLTSDGRMYDSHVVWWSRKMRYIMRRYVGQSGAWRILHSERLWMEAGRPGQALISDEQRRSGGSYG